MITCLKSIWFCPTVSLASIFLWRLVPVALQYFWAYALWSRKKQNSDVTFGPVACPFPHLLALLTHLLALHRTLRSRTPLHSFIRSLAYSWARWKLNNYMSQIDLVLSHAEPGIDLSSTSSVLLGVYALWLKKKQESKCKFWATRSSVSSFTCTAHS